MAAPQLVNQQGILSPIVEKKDVLDYPAIVKKQVLFILSEFLKHNTDPALNCEARRYMQYFDAKYNMPGG